MKRYVWAACCCLLSCLAVGAQSRLLNTPARKLQMAEYAITNLYVDSVDESKLVEEAIRAMLNELDPHSSYIDPEEGKHANEVMRGNFEGVGIQYNMYSDTLVVIQAIHGGPSEKVGILPGDRILEVDGTPIAGVKMSTGDIMNRLRGPKGSKVEVKVLRRGDPKLLTFTIKRDRIPLYSLNAAYMVDDHVGCIRINSFTATTGKEFDEALQKLKASGMKDLVLDLQGNPGGVLDASISVANQFLQKEQLITYTIGRRNPRTEFKADGKGSFLDGRVVVLINESSASASEIVSGALQDWDRAIVIGRRSFGKGLVQRSLGFADGSEMRVTVARYYTPSGRCIQKPYADKEKYSQDLIDRYNRGEMLSADSIHFPDSEKYKTLKLERTIYGGGGIMPDYFVPVDTTLYSKYYSDLSMKGAVAQLCLKLLDQNRKQWASKYKTFERFNKDFQITPAMLDELKAMGEKMGIPYKDDDFRTSLPLIRTQLKALLARDLWDMSEYFQVMGELDHNLQKAMELLSKPGMDFPKRN